MNQIEKESTKNPKLNPDEETMVDTNVGEIVKEIPLDIKNEEAGEKMVEIEPTLQLTDEEMRQQKFEELSKDNNFHGSPVQQHRYTMMMQNHNSGTAHYFWSK